MGSITGIINHQHSHQQHHHTTLLQLCRAYSSTREQKDNNNNNTVEITELLLQKHGKTLTILLRNILGFDNDGNNKFQPSEVLIPSNATPELLYGIKYFSN